MRLLGGHDQTQITGVTLLALLLCHPVQSIDEHVRDSVAELLKERENGTNGNTVLRAVTDSMD